MNGGVVVGRVVPSGSSFYSGTMSKAHFSPGFAVGVEVFKIKTQGGQR